MILVYKYYWAWFIKCIFYVLAFYFDFPYEWWFIHINSVLRYMYTWCFNSLTMFMFLCLFYFHGMVIFHTLCGWFLQDICSCMSSMVLTRMMWWLKCWWSLYDVQAFMCYLMKWWCVAKYWSYFTNFPTPYIVSHSITYAFL